MIYLFSGTPGSGKSLHQARLVYNWVNVLNNPCICNYEINTNMIKEKNRKNFVYVDNEKLTPEFLMKFSREFFKDHKFKEGKIRCFIDESQLLFNAREWDAKGRKQWTSFFTQHRKFGYDIYLIAQFDRMLDRQIRSLIEYEIIHRKISNFGWVGKLLSLIVGGKLFVSVLVWYPLKEKISSEFFVYRKKWSNFYDSYLDFSENDEKVKHQKPASVPEQADGNADERQKYLQTLCNMLNCIITNKLDGATVDDGG